MTVYGILSFWGKQLLLHSAAAFVDEAVRSTSVALPCKNQRSFADMAELADALDLGSSGTPVQVQVLLSAPPDWVWTQFAFGLFFYPNAQLVCRDFFTGCIPR